MSTLKDLKNNLPFKKTFPEIYGVYIVSGSFSKVLLIPEWTQELAAAKAITEFTDYCKKEHNTVVPLPTISVVKWGSMKLSDVIDRFTPEVEVLKEIVKDGH